MIGAALAVALSAGPQMRPWLDANTKSIARIHDSKVRRAQDRLFHQTLRELQSKRSEAVVIDGANAADLARKILSNGHRYRFAGVQKAPPKTWWDTVVQWLQARWNAILKLLFGRVRISDRTSVRLGDILLVLSVLTFLGLLVRLALQYAGGSSRPLAAAALQRHLDPASLVAGAEEDARHGRYGVAVTKLFAAALAVLHGRGNLGAQESETMGELRRRIAGAAPQAAAPFEALAAAVSLAVYADTVLNPSDWERARAAYAAIARDGEAHAA